MQLSIVIVTYNSDNYIIPCLQSIFENSNSFLEYEIIIVDNNSKNKIDFKSYPNVSLIQNKKNYGYSKALNIGIESSSTPYVLVLNPDVVFKNDVIGILSSYIKTDTRIGVIGCKIVDFNGIYQKYSMRRFPTFLNISTYLIKSLNKKITNLYNYEDYDSNKINKVDSISGCCMLFPRKVYNNVHGFNNKYFLYFEDTQFCLDINSDSHSVIYNNEAVVSHYGGASTEKLPVVYKKILFSISFIKYLFINIYQYKLHLINCILLILFIFKFLTN